MSHLSTNMWYTGAFILRLLKTKKMILRKCVLSLLRMGWRKKTNSQLCGGGSLSIASLRSSDRIVINYCHYRNWINIGNIKSYVVMYPVIFIFKTKDNFSNFVAHGVIIKELKSRVLKPTSEQLRLQNNDAHLSSFIVNTIKTGNYSLIFFEIIQILNDKFCSEKNSLNCHWSLYLQRRKQYFSHEIIIG
ncbi:hypothetical protein AGLY_000947 [Aphis glycines]|uniref:Uncharacterized protein n=1 Tax=Aphis glycines TaxID=307491 RepID=A0A6G0U8K4_APHGL|nr:hypothetical protein AGLY_000947 [Aphis glycines]